MPVPPMPTSRTPSAAARVSSPAGRCCSTYLGFATGFAALVGSFTGRGAQGLRHRHRRLVDRHRRRLACSLAWWLAYRDMRLAGRLMLALEAVAVVAHPRAVRRHPAAGASDAARNTAASFRALRRIQRLVGPGLRHGVQHPVLRAVSRAPRRWARRPSIRGAIFPSRCWAPCCSRHVLHVRRLLRSHRLRPARHQGSCELPGAAQ